MSKRLQVLMDEREWRLVRQAARANQQTVSEWVRQALRSCYTQRATGSAKKKLEAIRLAAQHEFPAPDIEQMNAEIAKGYASGWEP